MKHRLFIRTSFLSLLLCIACIVIWLRTHHAKFHLDFCDTPPIYYRFRTYPGSIALVRNTFPDPTLNNRPGPVIERKFLGFRTLLTWCYSGPQLPDGSWTHGTIREYAIPLWAPTTLFALIPLILLPSLLRTYRQSRRLRLGLCLNCAYDLRASQDRCPECGTPISPTAPGGREIA